MKQKDEIKLMSRSALIQYLGSVPSASKSDILDHALEFYRFEPGKDTLDNDRERIRSQVGGELKELMKLKAIRKSGNLYTLNRQPRQSLPDEEPYWDWVRELKESYPAEEMMPLIRRHCGDLGLQTGEDGNGRLELYCLLPDGLPVSMNRIYAGDVFETQTASPEVTEKKQPKQAKKVANAPKKAKRVVTVTKKSTAAASAGASVEPSEDERLEAEYLSMLHKKGGMFFEKFVASLLVKKLLASGLDVVDYCVIGGADDGGIDVVIDTVDEMGFCDHIVVQAKCHGRASVTENTIRDFYGSLKMQNGTRGIFITTTSFTSSAQNLLNVLNNCIGIDGATLFRWAKELSYGVHVGKNKSFLDPVILG